MANELVVIEKSTALDVFKSSDSVEDIISKVEREVNSFIPDVSTAKGRKEIISLAYKVAQSKTYLDGLGKDLVAELKEIPKLIDANRRAVRERFDTLRDKVRQPLIEWEVEQERIQMEEKHTEALEMNDEIDKENARHLALRIESDHEIALLMNEKRDRDLAEAKAKEELQRIAHEEELKRQAVEQARIEVEQKAQQERLAAELKAKQLAEAAANRERELKEQAELAEREKLEAIKRAEQAAKDAEIRAENEKRQAIAAEQKKAADAERARLAEVKRMADEEVRRQANKEHRMVINNKVMQDFINAGIPKDCAKACVSALVKNLIGDAKIIY